MQLRERIDARWIDALTDDDLRSAEALLHAQFTRVGAAERVRRGAAYDLMRGPEALTGVWMRRSMVSSAARARGVRVRTRR